MLTCCHAHKGGHTYVCNQGQRSREHFRHYSRGTTSALIQLSEEPLLPVKIPRAVSCHLAGYFQPLTGLSNFCQVPRSQRSFFSGHKHSTWGKMDMGANQLWRGVHHNLLRGFRMLLLESSLFSVSDLSEVFSASFSFLSLWLVLRRWRLRRR